MSSDDIDEFDSILDNAVNVSSIPDPNFVVNDDASVLDMTSIPLSHTYLPAAHDPDDLAAPKESKLAGSDVAEGISVLMNANHSVIAEEDEEVEDDDDDVDAAAPESNVDYTAFEDSSPKELIEVVVLTDLEKEEAEIDDLLAKAVDPNYVPISSLGIVDANHGDLPDDERKLAAEFEEATKIHHRKNFSDDSSTLKSLELVQQVVSTIEISTSFVSAIISSILLSSDTVSRIPDADKSIVDAELERLSRSSCLSRLIARYSGSISLVKLPPSLQRARSLTLAVACTPYSETNLTHSTIIRSSFTALTGIDSPSAGVCTAKFTAVSSKYPFSKLISAPGWQAAGYQRSGDFRTDLRGGGMLGPLHVLYFATYYPKQSRKLYSLSMDSLRSFPLMIQLFNFTAKTVTLLRDGLLSNFILEWTRLFYTPATSLVSRTDDVVIDVQSSPLNGHPLVNASSIDFRQFSDLMSPSLEKVSSDSMIVFHATAEFFSALSFAFLEDWETALDDPVKGRSLNINSLGVYVNSAALRTREDPIKVLQKLRNDR